MVEFSSQYSFGLLAIQYDLDRAEQIGSCLYSTIQVFITQADIMKDKKNDHKQYVQLCKNEKNGSCIYGNKKCWFSHENEQSNNKNQKHEKEIEENQKVTQRMFEMMETITQRVIEIEIKTNATNIK
jgi:hypothetical protein